MLRRAILLICLGFWAVPGLATWQLVREDSERHIRVYLDERQPYQGFYAVTRIQTRLSTVVAVLADVPATPEWVARVSEAKILKQKPHSEVWTYTVYKLPYPFKPRDTVLHSVLKQDGKSQVVTVESRALGRYLRPKPDHVRLRTMNSTWKLTPETNGWLKVELWGSGDPEGRMPSWLFNYNLADEPVQTLRNLRRMVLREKYQQQNLAYIKEH